MGVCVGLPYLGCGSRGLSDASGNCRSPEAVRQNPAGDVARKPNQRQRGSVLHPTSCHIKLCSELR